MARMMTGRTIAEVKKKIQKITTLAEPLASGRLGKSSCKQQEMRELPSSAANGLSLPFRPTVLL
jgi:hypothetical protein